MSVTRTNEIPDFKLPASTGQTLERSSFLGKVPLVIVFLPGLGDDDSRSQISEFDRMLSDFGSERSQVLIVAPETARRVREFADECGFSLPILADAGGAMARDYGVVASEASAPSVMIVSDADGRVVRRFDPAPSGGQAEAALAAIRALGRGYLQPEDGVVGSPD